VTVKLATGVIKTIAWEDIAPAPPRRAAKSMPVVEANTSVVFTADGEGVQLQHFDERAHSYVTICTGACEDPVAPRGRYRVAGAGITSSTEFEVAGSSTTVFAKPHPSRPHVAGFAMLATGSVAAGVAIGLVVAAASASSYSTSFCDGCPNFERTTPNDNTAINVAAATVSVVAGAVLIAGLVLVLATMTSVWVDHQVARQRFVMGADGLHF
jgi:hypothetical protein